MTLLINGSVIRKAEDAPAALWWAANNEVFSVHALYADREQLPVLMSSDNKTWPSIRAAELGLDYVFMRNATRKECIQFLDDNNMLDAEEVRV